MSKVGILVDGGFVKKKLSTKLRRFPTVVEVVEISSAIMDKPQLKGHDLFRVYFYDAPPFEGVAENPIDRKRVDFTNTPQANQNKALLDSLELQPHYAVRRGGILMTGWKLGRAALSELSKKPGKPIQANDLVPDMQQKGVDIRIGLDIASIAVKRIVDILVLVTGDSDFVPAMKFARKEGLLVYLECLGHGVRRELKVHADFVL